MAATSFTSVGEIISPKKDIYPATGAHLDLRVLKDDQYIDPGTIRSLLTRLKIGKEQKPLWQQSGSEWKPGYAITSGYGKREAPTKGASTFHLGQDYAIGEGTPLAWEGPGQYIPGRGFSTIKTTDPQGTPYEIRLLHTKPGKAANILNSAPPAPELPPPQQPAGDTYIFVGGQPKKQDSKDFLSSYWQSDLMGEIPQIKSTINPLALLQQAIFQKQDYMS